MILLDCFSERKLRFRYCIGNPPFELDFFYCTGSLLKKLSFNSKKVHNGGDKNMLSKGYLIKLIRKGCLQTATLESKERKLLITEKRKIARR